MKYEIISCHNFLSVFSGCPMEILVTLSEVFETKSKLMHPTSLLGLNFSSIIVIAYATKYNVIKS
jgi:hypothetical protein